MHLTTPLISIILILTLQFSCTEKTPQAETGRTEAIAPPTTDSLAFTSGIRAIFQDSQGHYWLGSHQEGLCRFDGVSFTYFTTQDGLPDHQIRSIQEDQNGHIWISTARGICRYDGQRLIAHVTPAIQPSTSPWTRTGRDLWFHAGNQPGVYRYDGQSMHYLAFPLPPAIGPDHAYWVTGLAAGQNHMLWISTYDGLFGYDGHQVTLINNASLGLQEERETLHIRSIFEDSKGRLWIGNNGIGVLVKEGDSITNFSRKHSLIDAASFGGGAPSPPGTLEHVFAIAEDGEGSIWFGDRDTDVWKYDGTTIQNYPVDAGHSTAMVWCIYRDKQDHLLVGRAGEGVYQWNGASFDRRF